MKETWKPVNGFENHFEVSDFGRVKSIDRVVNRPIKGGGLYPWNYKGKVLTGSNNGKGYYSFAVRDNNGLPKRTKLTHVLVWEAFKGDHAGMDIDHIDGDKSNNRLDNLRLLTRSQNMIAHYKKQNRRGEVALQGDKYMTRITHHGKRVYLGRYETEYDAYRVIRAFDEVFNNTL